MANQTLIEAIRKVYGQSRQVYGVSRIAQALRKLGHRCSRNRVARLMRQIGIQARKKRSYKVTTQSNHSHPIAPNTLAQQFQVSQLNKVWSSDITYIATAEGWLYLAVVMDLYSRQIIGWSMQRSLKRKLVLDALEMALQRRKPQQPLLHHSDRGSQYASGAYRALLDRHSIDPSMSRRGNCYDKPPVESFFSSLKKSVFDQKFTRLDMRPKSPCLITSRYFIIVNDFIHHWVIVARSSLSSWLHSLNSVSTFSGIHQFESGS